MGQPEKVVNIMSYEILTTKQRILNSAVHLFAAKGFTETTIRELAAEAGINTASMYYHFPSKTSILEYILNDYAENIANTLHHDKLLELKENPTADNILACLMLDFPEGKEEYYLKALSVMLQEQYRNATVRKILSEHTILGGERIIKIIVNTLIDFNVLAKDTDPDFWAKAHSSFIYAFASRNSLGIGDNAPGFSGMGLVEILRSMYDMLLNTCAADKNNPL